MNILKLMYVYISIFFKNLFRHTRRRIKLDLKEYFDKEFNAHASKVSTLDLVAKIFTFCELYSGITMYPYQEQFSKRVIRSVLENDGADITALFARQSGKSEAIATTMGGMMIILPQLANLPMFLDDKRLQMFQDGFTVGIFAPSQRQAQVTYGRMKSRMQSKSAMIVLQDPDFRMEFSTSNGQTVALTNGSFGTAISASEGSQIEGESFKLLIYEECQDISNYKIRKSISPMGSAYNATSVKIGTPTTHTGDFYESIERNKSDYDNGRLPIKNHFEYDYSVVQKYNPKYKSYVEKQKYILGEDSDEFQMSYNLKWILQRGMFIDLDVFEKNNGEPMLDRVMSDQTKSHVVGIDLAGKEDSSVITVVEVDWENPVISEEQYNEETGETESFKCYGTVIKDWLEIQNVNDYNDQYYEIIDYLRNFKVARAVVDSTKESSVAHRMRANVDYEVIPFIFSSKSKSDIYKYLEREIKSGRAKYPNSKEASKTREHKRFLNQLVDLQKEYRGAYLVVSHPEERGARDDYCLSLETEILTKRGFLTHDELNKEDLVASVEDNKVVYTKPTNIILKEYEGDMYRFKSKDINLEVTENHKMIIRDRHTGKEEILLSQDLAKMNNNTRYNNRTIPVAPVQDSKEYDISDDMIRQIAWLITEGWVNQGKNMTHYRYSFAQSKEDRGYESILKFVEKLDMKPYTYQRKDGVTFWTFHAKDNKIFDSILKEGIHRIPREWLNNFSQRQLILLRETLMLGEGTISRKTYHTNSEDLAKDFQELCHKTGIKTSIRKRVSKDGYVMYNCYMMNKDESRIKEVEQYYYKGKVWCVNVNNGFIVTRNSNKIAVTGNCDSWCLAVWGTSEEGDVTKIETKDKNPMYDNSSNSSFYQIRNSITAKRR